jgi:nuclear pore complex protein Nup98-Nup96
VDGLQVSFFSDADEVLTTPKADLMFIPRENPRALFIRQPDQTSLTPRTSKSTTDVRDIAMPVQGNGESGKPSTLHEISTSLQSPF